jgi:hypothetical protein
MKIYVPNRDGLADALALASLRGLDVRVIVLHDAACKPSLCSCELAFIVEGRAADAHVADAEARARWAKGALS